MANNLGRFDPFRDLTRIDPFLNIEDMFSDFPLMPSLRGMEAAPRIRMDVSETEKAYTLRAEIPGAKKDDIKISIDGNQVTLRAEVRKEDEQNGGNVVRSERYYGQQYRSVTLPQGIDDANATAKYQDGILELTLPKKAGSGGKQLSIQ